MQEVYDKIPFSELRNIKECEPLFEIKELIHLLKKEIDGFLEKPDKYTQKKIALIVTLIIALGQLYHKYLEDLVYQIKQNHGYEDYKIEVGHIEKTREELEKKGMVRHIMGTWYVTTNISFYKEEILQCRRDLERYCHLRKEEALKKF